MTTPYQQTDLPTEQMTLEQLRDPVLTDQRLNAFDAAQDTYRKLASGWTEVRDDIHRVVAEAHAAHTGRAADAAAAHLRALAGPGDAAAQEAGRAESALLNQSGYTERAQNQLAAADADPGFTLPQGIGNAIRSAGPVVPAAPLLAWGVDAYADADARERAKAETLVRHEMWLYQRNTNNNLVTGFAAFAPPPEPGGEKPGESRTRQPNGVDWNRPVQPANGQVPPPPGTGGPGSNPPGTGPSDITPPGISPTGVNPPGITPPGVNPSGVSPTGVSPYSVNPPGTTPPWANPPGTTPPGTTLNSTPTWAIPPDRRRWNGSDRNNQQPPLPYQPIPSTPTDDYRQRPPLAANPRFDERAARGPAGPAGLTAGADAARNPANQRPPIGGAPLGGHGGGHQGGDEAHQRAPYLLEDDPDSIWFAGMPHHVDPVIGGGRT